MLDTMFVKLFAEILGTFVFLAVIITSVHAKTAFDNSVAWLKIGLALSVAILLVGAISGGHLNPAVSFMFYLNKEISLETLLYYMAAQFMGGGLAFLFYGLQK